MKERLAKMNTSWFADLVTAEVEKRGRGGGAELARLMTEALGYKVDQSRISNWQAGVEPTLYNAEVFLRIIGGNMQRAMPDWHPDIRPEPVKVLGQVQAGAFSLAGDGDGEINLDLTVWRESPYYTLTTGEMGVVQIVGDSMEPKYSAGEFLICRAPVDYKKLQDLTPCIFSGPDGSTFKLLRTTRDGTIIGQPLNPHHEIVIIDDRDISVQLVILGSVDLGYTKPIRNVKPKSKTRRSSR